MIERSILIVDDEKRMTDSLRALLTARKYEVHTAQSGAEAIAALEERAFPVVVTDLRMQGVDGLNVIRFAHEKRPKTLFIVITGYASTESAIEALHFHAFDYIRKPFEFDHLRASIERAFHKLEADQLREDTAAMITHDIKAPLTSIIGFSALIHDRQAGEFHPRAPEFAQAIRGNAQKILSLVDNYLTTCKIDSDALAIGPSKINIAEMARDVLELFAAEAERNGFTFEVDIALDPPEAILDETYIYRSIGNLIQNALKYGDPAAPILFRAARLAEDESPLGKETLEIEVRNLAPRVSPDSLEGLFGRFRRASDKVGIEGSGIGLYVVDAVSRAHGGRPRARCLEGGFVGFSLLLPMDLAPLQSPVGA